MRTILPRNTHLDPVDTYPRWPTVVLGTFSNTNYAFTDGLLRPSSLVCFMVLLSWSADSYFQALSASTATVRMRCMQSQRGDGAPDSEVPSRKILTKEAVHLCCLKALSKSQFITQAVDHQSLCFQCSDGVVPRSSPGRLIVPQLEDDQLETLYWDYYPLRRLSITFRPAAREEVEGSLDDEGVRLDEDAGFASAGAFKI
ncbi:hypothetical protein C8R46DRAFT_1042324 [Mycena filopes]|nr:hypothetical protein C8R46DRAFT_1042324 [Mycena filopes]